jgi:hypothetical protein
VSKPSVKRAKRGASGSWAPDLPMACRRRARLEVLRPMVPGYVEAKVKHGALAQTRRPHALSCHNRPNVSPIERLYLL